MGTVESLGWFATIITTIYTCFGMPVQIYKSIQHKSVGSLSLVNTFMMCATFTSWVIYAAAKTPPDKFVIISNAPGTICSACLLVLFAVYGRDKER